ncbi:phosphatidylethanolamine-binding protein 4 isoform X2 [Peromyscus maniculatus bairdii]|uniref:phosphatidylethanolamine-binding protein 4 isoform X2 n=1 Tax=Peromyscus maniculatus bairdii TaxID=230844 RepID=UPI003FD1FC3A
MPLGQLPGNTPMKLGAAALCLCLLAAAVWLSLSMTTSESSGGGGGGGPGGGKKCAPTPLPRADVSLCRNLEVSYPELGNISCQVVPRCNMYRRKITNWPQPKVKYPAALAGADLKTGTIRGSVITDYGPPTPPPTTGLHRYQFFVFLQGTSTIPAPPKQNGDRGAWEMDDFLRNYRLPQAVTSTQFMTEYE